MNPTGGPAVIPPQEPRQPHNLGTIRSLAITQLVIGVLIIIFGIAVIASLSSITWTTNSGAGLWAGGWITITGIIGVCSFHSSTNSLNGVYMAFSIVCTCVCGLAGLFSIIALSFYSDDNSCYRRWMMVYPCNRKIGLGLHAPLLILITAEFFVSIFAAIYAGQQGCCSGGGHGGVIFQQAQPQISVINAGQGAGGYQYTIPQYGQPPPQYVQQYSQPVQQYRQPMYLQGQTHAQQIYVS